MRATSAPHWPSPAATAQMCMGRSASISLGVVTFSSSPWPSLPSEPDPNEYTSPAWLRASVWAETATERMRTACSGTSVGTVSRATPGPWAEKEVCYEFGLLWCRTFRCSSYCFYYPNV